MADYVPSVDATTAFTAFADYLSRIPVAKGGPFPALKNAPASVTGQGYPSMAIFDAMIAILPAVTSNNVLGPAVVLAVNPFAVTDEAFIAATANGLIQLPVCVDANNGRIVIVAVGNNGASVETQGANVLRDHSGGAIATPYALPSNSLWIFEFIDSNVWQSVGAKVGSPWSFDSKAADFNAAISSVAFVHYEVDTTGGNVIATLPAAFGRAGAEGLFIKTVAANTLTIAAADNINGAASQAIVGAWDSIAVRCTGTTWHVIG